ncbi:hypothetical protein C9J01_02035 [Photobacterium rosenbergii]|uniref:Uncharacterized protein n=1 Tax=Photobacterium rosenbergii TaxID=294936 RepID=A0A2T3NJY2_9GAMM|nr:hypothetical protein [Photobacterium rosenbergii]PSW15818.1 hypothetical protein C9J01_02035 [Photobacterium rosenbergii]
MNKVIIIFCASLSCPTVVAEDVKLGQSLNQMVRLQTVDPLAESKVPLGSPTFSGKKASKSFKTESSGSEQKALKNKDIISGVGN